jgi:hypothetical protein
MDEVYDKELEWCFWRVGKPGARRMPGMAIRVWVPGTGSDGAGYGDDFLSVSGTRTRTKTDMGWIFFLTHG